jgi:Amt family ammonium transporter
MNFFAWMVFVPLWLTFSYTIGAFCEPRDTRVGR